MTTDDTRAIARQMADVMAMFRTDADGAIAALAPLLADDITFVDPLQTLRGSAAVLEMNRRIAKRSRFMAFEVHKTVSEQSSAFLTWTMTYRPKTMPTLTFEGASHLTVADGRVVHHRDYWDLLSSVAASLPFVRPIYAALAARLG